MSAPWGGGGEHTPLPGRRWLASPAAVMETVTFRLQQAGAWVTTTAVPKVYLAGAWVFRRPKRWTGSSWTDLP